MSVNIPTIPDELQAKEMIKSIVLKKLPEKEFTVFLFGSRATGHAAKYADYDIGILGKEKVDLILIGEIRDELDDTIIPCFFDLVDFNRVSESFYQTASKQVEIWQQGPVFLKNKTN